MSSVVQSSLITKLQDVSSRQKLKPTVGTVQLLPEAPGNQEPVYVYSLLIWIFQKHELMHWMAFGVLASSTQGFYKTHLCDGIPLLLWVKNTSF